MSAPKEGRADLPLRAKPRPVKRLNRKTIVAVIGVFSLATLCAALFGLRRHAPGASLAPSTPQNLERVPHAEALDSMPHDYSGVRVIPRLGSPIGELGRPVLKSEEAAGIPHLPERASFKPNPEEDAQRAERLHQEAQAKEAAQAQLFVQLRERARLEAGATPATPRPSQSEALAAGDAIAARYTGASNAPAATLANHPTQSAQDHRQAFMNAEADPHVYASGTMIEPRSPWQLMAGTTIAAALVTGINSDLPGSIIASVTENVYDTVTGRAVLIPQGARLLGEYDAQVAYGQRRVLLVWTRLILPDGSSIVLDRLPGTDSEGHAGLEDRTNWHWDRIFAGAALSTLLGAGAELAVPQYANASGSVTVVVATRQSLQDSVNQVGQEMTRRNLDIAPTLTIRPGFPVRVIVNRDLVLRPYPSSSNEKADPS